MDMSGHPPCPNIIRPLYDPLNNESTTNSCSTTATFITTSSNGTDHPLNQLVKDLDDPSGTLGLSEFLKWIRFLKSSISYLKNTQFKFFQKAGCAGPSAKYTWKQKNFFRYCSLVRGLLIEPPPPLSHWQIWTRGSHSRGYYSWGLLLEPACRHEFHEVVYFYLSG